MDNESIKIEIQDQDENSDMADLNKNNLKGGNDMETENKTVLNDYNDKRLENIGIEDEMDLFFILDRSGSMSGSERDTINGFNAFIEKQAVKKQNIRVTTILFDDKYQVLYSRKPISEVEALTEKEYYVRGCTALLDSIGKTVNSYKNEVGSTMCIITSDGYENASREYDRDQIRRIIESCGWEFVFIGADIDSYAEASRIGIRKSRVANYNKTAEGHKEMYDACNLITDRFYRKRDLKDNNEDWKEKLD
jgi:hypothetical protein